MKLYHNPASPFVRKVVVVAIECDLREQIELETIILTPVAPHAGLTNENPLGKIPALVLDNGECLYDSRVICEYLDTIGNGRLFPGTGDARLAALRRQALADGLNDAAVSIRYERAVRPEELRWQEWIDGQVAKCRSAVACLEQECASFTDSVDIGTLSAAVALGYLDFRMPELLWRDSAPELAAWYEQFSTRASLHQTAPA